MGFELLSVNDNKCFACLKSNWPEFWPGFDVELCCGMTNLVAHCLHGLYGIINRRVMKIHYRLTITNANGKFIYIYIFKEGKDCQPHKLVIISLLCNPVCNINFCQKAVICCTFTDTMDVWESFPHRRSLFSCMLMTLEWELGLIRTPGRRMWKGGRRWVSPIPAHPIFLNSWSVHWGLFGVGKARKDVPTPAHVYFSVLFCICAPHNFSWWLVGILIPIILALELIILSISAFPSFSWLSPTFISIPFNCFSLWTVKQY